MVDRNALPWPPNPVRVDGVLNVSLLGLEFAQVRLDLTIRAASWIIGRVEAAHGDVALAELSRNERLTLAADVDLVGRSRMTKSELISSLSG